MDEMAERMSSSLFDKWVGYLTITAPPPKEDDR